MTTTKKTIFEAGAAYDKRRKFVQKVFFTLFRGAAAVNGIALLTIIYFMLANGWRAISWEFLTQPPMESMTKGGILPCIVGTFCPASVPSSLRCPSASLRPYT